jgi:hypothetical protein
MNKLSLVCCLLLALINTYSFADEWVAYQQYYSNQTISVPNYSTYHVPVIRQASPDIARIPFLTYTWVPYYVNNAIVYEKHSIFCTHRTITLQPNLIWIYQPIWRY